MRYAVPMLLALGACGGEPVVTNRQSDVAMTTRRDIAAAGSVKPPAPVAAPTIAALLPTPVATGVADGSAEAAVAVVRRYYARIGAHDFAAAWRLWSESGRASQLTERAFAASFVRYAEYRARIGAPGRIDAGAGQRYIEIPVRVTGTLADGGRPFALAGTLTLHRTGDVDGATLEQRSWRISASSIGAGPQDAAAVATGRYRCAGATRVSERSGGAAIWRRGDAAPEPCTATE